jgi:hypothetical protein
MRRSLLLAGCMAIGAVMLAGCATLPAAEATAFKKMASAKREAFDNVATAEAAALSSLAAADIDAGFGRFTVASCSSAVDSQACVVTYDRNGATYPLTTAAPHARELVAGIADYGAAMAELAEAKDLEDAKASAEAVGASVKSLAAIVPGAPAFVGPLVDAAVWTGQKRIVEKRRQALLGAARKAHPVVRLAGEELGRIALPLKENLVRASSQRVTNAATRIGLSQQEEQRLRQQIAGLKPAQIVERAALVRTMGDERVVRRADSQELFAAAQGLNAARAIKTDFTGLEKAHSKLLDRLANPKISLEDALADLNEFLGHVDAIEAAGQGADNG